MRTFARRPAWSAVLAGALLAACGQTGSLYLPDEPAAANRATLPQALRPGAPTPTNPTVPPAPAAAPAVP